MIYKIAAISDIHWGVIDPNLQMRYLEFFREFLYLHGNDIDLLVILGDYFDSKLSLNSSQALISNEWFHSILDLCEKNSIVLRLVQGTNSHDNDQLEVFSPLENDFFKIIFSTTVEETLPDLTCVYCPDELLQTSIYEDTYLDEILQRKDIGFFHGSFDVVYGRLLESKPTILDKNNVVFRYELWNKTINGPMIAGHWHDGKTYDDLYYCGSPFRYAFDEEEPKGFLLIQYDTESKEYGVGRILNPISPEYITYEIYTNMYQTKEDYQKAIEDIRKVLQGFESYKYHILSKLRVLIYILDEKTENDILLSSLRGEFSQNRNVKITVKNKLKDKKTKERKEISKKREEQFQFIYNKDAKKVHEIIHDFILETSPENVNIPIEFIEEKCKIKGGI